MATTDQIAFAAGLFEGEGCIDFRSNGSSSDKKYPRLSMRMTDGDTMHRFRDIVDAGVVSGPHNAKTPSGESAKGFYQWHILNKNDVHRILMDFSPWLGSRRRKKADEAFALLASITTFAERRA